MEETRKLKLKQKDEREKAKLNKHMLRLAGGTSLADNRSSPVTNHEIEVQGIRFRVAKNGSKLVKVPGESPQTTVSSEEAWPYNLVLGSPSPGDNNAAKSTPKTAIVGGVRFYRSKNGNMYRSGIIKAQRYERPLIEKARKGHFHHESADLFDTRRSGVIKKVNEPCKIFSTTGSFFLSNSRSYWFLMTNDVEVRMGLS